jgi:hypothetical protein
MKMRVLNKALKESSKTYYTSRSKKVINLTERLNEKKNVKFTLSNCIILKEKNHIIIKKEKKN